MVDSSQVNGQAGNGPWWANEPVTVPDAPTPCVSLVTPTKPAVEPDWTGCPVVHLTGCPIIPTTTYAIAAESGGALSADALFDTQAKPDINWFGDVTGGFNSAEGKHRPPDGLADIDDAFAAILTFQNPSALPGCAIPPCNATHTSVSDIHPFLNGDAPNRLVNINDVFAIILGFQGNEYPGPQLELCLDP